MNCKNCGKDIPAEGKFCLYCGSALDMSSNVKPAKKRNIAVLALGALSVLLAIALALSLTGVIGAAGGSAAAASKSFGTPEDAINYFVERLKEGDFEGALNACAINEIAKGFDYKANAERSQLLTGIGKWYMPSEYKQYIIYNRSVLEQLIITQMAGFAASFNISEEYKGLAEGSVITLPDGKLPDGIIEQLDPSKISGLKLVDIGKARKHDEERNREMLKRQAKEYGAQDIQTRTVLYEYNGKLYVGGFTVIEFGGGWMIWNMTDPLAGIPSRGTPIPVADRPAYEDLLQ